jgi:glycosyltransferase involved in cell wall biosynthesis
MLDPWAWEHHRMRKRIVWLAGQRANLAEAACIHATAEQEYDFTRRVGVTAPVAIIPNGVPIPEAVPAAREAKHRRLLFLARIHEKKGVDVLLRAWCAVEHRFPDWELRIVGPDDGGHLPRMQALARQLGVERVTFAGRVPEERKGDEYREAEIYVLPTENENWGVSIADALALGVPAIVTKGAPWSGLETHECGWWIDKSVDALADCLDEALRCPPEDLRRRGARGRAWMERDYAWSRIGEMMDRTYRWLLEGGSPPAWVATD